MASNYPTSLDIETGVGGAATPVPDTTDPTNSPSHAGLHQKVGDAIIATQTKVGTGSSTPAANQVLTGTGSGTSAWAQVTAGMLAAGSITNADLDLSFAAPSYTPVWTQGVTLTTSADDWMYIKLGELSLLIGGCTFSSSGTADDTVLMTLPDGLQSTSFVVGGGAFWRPSAGRGGYWHPEGVTAGAEGTGDIRFRVSYSYSPSYGYNATSVSWLLGESGTVFEDTVVNSSYMKNVFLIYRNNT